MRLRDLPGWASAIEGARQTWPWVPVEAWARVAELDAGGQEFVCSQNELYSAGMTAGLVKLRREYPR